MKKILCSPSKKVKTVLILSTSLLGLTMSNLLFAGKVNKGQTNPSTTTNVIPYTLTGDGLDVSNDPETMDAIANWVNDTVTKLKFILDLESAQSVSTQLATYNSLLEKSLPLCKTKGNEILLCWILKRGQMLSNHLVEMEMEEGTSFQKAAKERTQLQIVREFISWAILYHTDKTVFLDQLQAGIPVDYAYFAFYFFRRIYDLHLNFFDISLQYKVLWYGLRWMVRDIEQDEKVLDFAELHYFVRQNPRMDGTYPLEAPSNPGSWYLNNWYHLVELVTNTNKTSKTL